MGKYVLFLNRVSHLFLFVGLIIFFVLHAKNDFVEILQLKVVISTLLGLCIVSFIYWTISLLFLRNKKKASLFTAVSFFALLFYNLVQLLSRLLNTTSIGISDRIFLGLIILLLFFIVFFSKAPGEKFLFFGKTVFAFLICYEFVFLVYNSIAIPKKSHAFINTQEMNPDIEKMPSVYLLVLDEYAGAETLKDRFSYLNDGFYTKLEDLEFKILKHTHSNYQYTALSIASTLNGNYIQLKKDVPVYSPESFKVAMSTVYNNQTVETFRRLGYSIKNYSPFSMREHTSRYSNRFLHTDYWLILYSTFFDRVIEMAPYFLARRMGSEKKLEKLFARQINLSLEITDNVLKGSLKKETKPTFTYIHLMMPHAPYAADSTGKVNLPFLTSKSANKTQRMNAYLQYLVFTNNIVGDFLTKLKANTKGEAVILLMSDHGLRDPSIVSDANSKFNNLNAVFLPEGYSGEWHDGMSNVNQFRVLFSSLTKQKIPLLKDSLVY